MAKRILRLCHWCGDWANRPDPHLAESVTGEEIHTCNWCTPWEATR